MVALSYYDAETVSMVSSDIRTQTLFFYDVTLVRKAGNGYVGYKILYAVSDVLARFMMENEGSVLCFYCDADTDVRRSHTNMPPQEYRSVLFSRMFDIYVKSHNLHSFINHRIEIDYTSNSQKRQFAHFICRKEDEEAVVTLGHSLMQK